MIEQRQNMSLSVLGEAKTWDAIEWGSINEEIVTAEINKRKNAPTELIDFALDPYDVGIAMGKFKDDSSDRIYTALCTKTPYGEVDLKFSQFIFRCRLMLVGMVTTTVCRMRFSVIAMISVCAVCLLMEKESGLASIASICLSC